MIKPHKLTDIDQFVYRIFKILTNGKTQISSYIFNNIDNRWEYFSRRGNKWKFDKNHRKFTRFLLKGFLPHLKTIGEDLREKIPYIRKILEMLVDKEGRMRFIETILTKLLPLICTAGTSLLLAL